MSKVDETIEETGFSGEDDEALIWLRLTLEKAMTKKLHELGDEAVKMSIFSKAEED